MTTPDASQMPPLPDLLTLAMRLSNAAYTRGLADNTPDKSDSYYSKADDKSTAALSLVISGIAELEAKLATAMSALAQAREWAKGDKWRFDPQNKCFWQNYVDTLDAALTLKEQQ